MLQTPLGRFRIVSILEGISFLLLLGIAMPLKYLAGFPEAVEVVGMAHGVLFILYVAAVFYVTLALRWSFKRMLAALFASVVPFGPFIFDRTLRQEA